MVDGLIETAAELESKGIWFCLKIENPADGIVAFAAEVKASAIVTDEDYLRTGQEWRAHASAQLRVRMIQVDSDTVVPVRNQLKEEWGAYTIRPKIRKALPTYLCETPTTQPKHKWHGQVCDCIDMDSIMGMLPTLDYSQNVFPVSGVAGGISQARSRLDSFISSSLSRYKDGSGDIGEDLTSGLSPYLHFGQISPVEIALRVSESDAPGESVDGFLEQLIVRRELAINFCFYNRSYDSLTAAPNWALRTLENHRYDPRPVLYDIDELEKFTTHDDLWNASQKELVDHGRIHSYMRMLWAKKIAEWSPSPEDALARAIYLNDKYALDGRDPNGYAGIAWSIFGKHDRPFANRPIFGMVRYMSSESTKRRKHWKEYIARI
jgi:deoxyribodipyrimidine photo-lyase